MVRAGQDQGVKRGTPAFFDNRNSANQHVIRLLASDIPVLDSLLPGETFTYLEHVLRKQCTN
jgi:hypothetical protein